MLMLLVQGQYSEDHLAGTLGKVIAQPWDLSIVQAQMYSVLKAIFFICFATLVTQMDSV